MRAAERYRWAPYDVNSSMPRRLLILNQLRINWIFIRVVFRKTERTTSYQ